jgi:hypothetical protein
MLNTKEFNQLSNRIINSLYAIDPDIKDLYDIHINYIDDAWQVDFVPENDNIPVIKVDTYTEYDNNNQEILRIIPKNLTDLPEMLKFKDEDKSYDLCVNYVTVFEFILGLYDFEYRLS